MLGGNPFGTVHQQALCKMQITRIVMRNQKN